LLRHTVIQKHFKATRDPAMFRSLFSWRLGVLGGKGGLIFLNREGAKDAKGDVGWCESLPN
ncbi:hypothetical protein, partial [Desulfatirhabdium butyrativorans]|uniref:hypothetical protein n=1 Tax=Desulfatirhabdium butyrativorans TaxID=340467 RepID=UPI001B7FD4E3